MKNKILMVILLTASLFVLTSCAKKKEDTQYCDDAFLKSMAQGLDERWNAKSSDDLNLTPGSEDQQEHFSKLVNNELNNIQNYKDKKFKNSGLQELAIKYINQLKAQKSALKYMTVNYTKYADLWDKAYDERSKLIIEINKKYHLDISEKNKKSLEEMGTNAKEANEEDDIKDKINQMVKSAKLKLVSSEYDYKDYKIILENPTSVKFSSFQLDVKLKDKDDIIIETLTDYATDWEPKTKVQFTFNTDKKFKKYEIVSSYYTD